MSHPLHRNRPLDLSRRGFLGLTGGAALAAGLGLAGCAPDSGSKTASVATALLPSTAPIGWQPALAAFNAKLKEAHGFTLNATFINWSNYGQQSLLKFTAGEKFDTALQALWLNMAQLQADGALTDLTGKLDAYPNLAKTLAPELIESNSWNGKLWGVPQVNSAARIQHFTIRQDLLDKVGADEITDYASLERFLYLVKEKGGGTIPFGANSNNTNLLAIPAPTGMFNAASWEDPHTISFAFSGKGLFFIPAKDAATTGSAQMIPFWEDAGVIETFHRLRKYHDDKIINADALNSDAATIKDQWTAGKYAATWAITDGQSSNILPQLQQAVSGAALSDVAPFSAGMDAKPNQTFQADNLVVLNAKGGDEGRALQLQDFLSIQENHDLISYGIEGTDWKPADNNKYEQISRYQFPGYALCWRASLERKPTYMNETEEVLFDWAQDYGNFTVDPFASFIPNITPVKDSAAQMVSVITQYANPLYYGVVDVDKQLDKLKKAAEGAGLDKLQAEMETQANAHLANSK